MKGMCSVIKELTSQVKALSSRQVPDQDAVPIPTPVHPRAPQPPPQTQDYRTLIREEVKELKEREKRREFLVIKGLPASSFTDFRSKFEQLALDYLEARVDTPEIRIIPGLANLFRVRIADDDTRKRLLDNGKKT